MKYGPLLNKLCIAGLLLFSSRSLWADEIRVAVASNFHGAAKAISQQFEAISGHKVKLVFGSTGKHYTQIHNGAPFDAFFAADTRRAELLDEEGVAVAGSRFTYAIGHLVLWSPKAGYVDPRGEILETGDFDRLSIANPKLAPYGKAAQQVLQKRNLWGKLRRRLVRGENIGQAFQFVKSGNVALGFVAYSQIKRPDQAPEGSYWIVPQTLYSPIEQQAVLLKDNAAAQAFLAYVRSSQGQRLIQRHGYSTP